MLLRVQDGLNLPHSMKLCTIIIFLVNYKVDDFVTVLPAVTKLLFHIMILENNL